MIIWQHTIQYLQKQKTLEHKKHEKEYIWIQSNKNMQWNEVWSLQHSFDLTDSVLSLENSLFIQLPPH